MGELWWLRECLVGAEVVIGREGEGGTLHAAMVEVVVVALDLVGELGDGELVGPRVELSAVNVGALRRSLGVLSRRLAVLVPDGDVDDV